MLVDRIGRQEAKTALIVARFEAHLVASRPATKAPFRNVNDTVACTLPAVKKGFLVAPGAKTV